MNTIKIFFINNDGGGFAENIEITRGTTVAQLFSQKMGPGADPKKFLIRVNRQPCESNRPLVENDRVSFTPAKIEGAV